MNNTPAINVAIEKEIHREIRIKAAEQDKKIQEIVNDVLRKWLSSQQGPTPNKRAGHPAQS
jgi:plasmid stability protein